MKDMVIGTFYLDKDSLNLSVQDDLYALIIEKGLGDKLDDVLTDMMDLINEAVKGE